MQVLTQKQSLLKELNPDCEELNEINKIKMKNIISNTCDQKHIQIYHLVAQLKIQYCVTMRKI